MSDVSRLPGAFEHYWQWQLHAACRSADSGLFFHPPGERNPAHDDRDAAAKAVCAGCPVREACLDHALRTRETYGVWGGLSAEERASALRTRRRGVTHRRHVAA
ncbi:WhiB family transcriptional regulator [Kitasatospora sp. NBC_01250]|uniref:WhiB family transcriptional regulator n=1 Tax=unclassified Kitasatospora TaxID=2633591 RepID=UPI002E15F793|nr:MULTISPECIES: WhiB family transcriptional regulator [unclassified Kitasatospora]WSJ71496.1 WhiB family transcriptional regulator [Kitasatospora sp. NBC_01302]